MKALPKRNYIKGKKLTVSIRLPTELKEELDKIANELGRSFSDFLQEGLDQWATLHREQSESKKKR